MKKVKTVKLYLNYSPDVDSNGKIQFNKSYSKRMYTGSIYVGNNKPIRFNLNTKRGALNYYIFDTKLRRDAYLNNIENDKKELLKAEKAIQVAKYWGIK